MSGRRVPFCIVLLAAALSASSMQSTPSDAGEPLLELEKPVYSDSESIRLWVGVSKSTNELSHKLRNSCILHVTLPNGGKVDYPVSFPLDGDVSRGGWKGGWTLDRKSQVPGSYAVAFEFAGRRTAQQSLTIVKDPFAGVLRAEWLFFDRLSGSVNPWGASLRVVNRTGKVVRFAEPGLPDGEVWVRVKQFDPPLQESVLANESFFVNSSGPPAFSFERVTWSEISRWPVVTVPPGGSVERPLSLQARYPFQEGKEYQVKLDTVLTLFAGEHDNPDAALFPLRLPVSATQRFRW